MSVAVEIPDGHTGSILEDVGQCITRASEVSTTIIQVESGTQRILLAPEFVAAAHDYQVRMAISVRVEKTGADIF